MSLLYLEAQQTKMLHGLPVGMVVGWPALESGSGGYVCPRLGQGPGVLKPPSVKLSSLPSGKMTYGEQVRAPGLDTCLLLTLVAV